MITKKATIKKTARKKSIPAHTARADVSKADAAVALKADVYTALGKKHGSITLPESVFGLPWNGSLVQQVVTSMQANARTPVAHAKTRGEVRGGGKKPWKQKGTGRARHGSIRSPIWVGGGVAHGPRKDKDYSKKINRKMRVKALYIALSRKIKEGEALFVDSLSFTAPKTAEAKKLLSAFSGIKGFDLLGTKGKNAALIALARKDASVSKSFQNFGNVTVVEAKDLNPVVVLKHSRIIFVNPEEAIKMLAARA